MHIPMSFRFNYSKMLPLIEHALRAAPTAIINDRFDPALLKEGAVVDDFGMARIEDVDTTRIPRRLVLVKDSGIYLMCCTDPELKDPNDASSAYVVYAEGYGPDVHVPGDDFGEPIDLDWIVQADNKASLAGKEPVALEIEMGESQFSITLISRPARDAAAATA